MSASYSETVTGNYRISSVWNTILTTVRVTHLPTGLHATGNAKLHPDDDYNLVIGLRLATIRAQARLLAKIGDKLERYPVEYSDLLGD